MRERVPLLLTIYYDPRAALQLLALVRAMRLDDVLSSPHGRLERIRPEVGFEHYLLYQAGQPVGLQYVRAQHWLDDVQRGLAATLSAAGWTAKNTVLRIGVAQTPLRFEHNRLRKLFEIGDE